MAEKYRFFDATQDEDGQYDREYNAQEFTDYFKALVTTGVMKGANKELEVSANGSNMITKIDTGIAFILGKYYENDSFLELTHDTETLGKSRIDRIVIRLDMSTEARYVKAFIKKGVPSAAPIAPILTQNANLYEISLAQVKIVGGQTFIANNAVTDERGKDVICPWASSNILPNFDNNAVLEELGRKANKQQEMPVPVVYNAGWGNAGAWEGLTYYKDNFNVVHLTGTAYRSTGGSIATVLPVGYRPTKSVGCATNTSGVVSLSGNGSVIVTGTDLANINISFRIL